MADDETKEFIGYTYKIRAGNPMKVGDGTGYLHTFMAESNEVIVKPVVESSDMLESKDMLANGGDYISANYNRYKDKSGDKFNGKEVKKPEYIDEDEVPGFSDGG